MLLLLKGCFIGLAIAAPVGPVGVICIRRSLAQGAKYGFISGLGAATADAIYGCVAAFGFTWLTSLLIGYQAWLQSLGGLLLVLLGIQTWYSKPANLNTEVSRKGLLAAYASVFAITITNPMTILAFAGIIAGADIAIAHSNLGPALLLVAGVFTGSLIWWLFISFTASRLSTKIKPTSLLWINRASSIFIAFYGVWAFLSAYN
ncbi:threonine/homoserine/homoserine lactone efflux protein [Paenibacillus turicensis]|uniref:Threonine/homoserine/homoserine lactone efflux protein n=1 Tax=Paenibacillus turicensis TaxID=160487 RepID=A0ABS4FSE2_9BACL|nr:LysE family transporter [Paenibacillus turicensis]MBP1905513.1 threonine/homoserine/homoserine lactone efflux protein [Paenibacillus turicensis]